MKIPIIIMLLMFTYIGSCSYISNSRNIAFDDLKIGDTEATVIRLFGSPSVRHEQGIVFYRYASRPCEGNCVERLWYENRMSFDIEAWSVDLDNSHKVIKKSRWVSP